jgi:chromosomal replication initiator protein
MNNTDIWKKTLAQIEIKLDSPAHFKTWFRDTRLIEIDGKKATIGVKNSYTADWLTKKHSKLIRDTLSFVYGKDILIHLIYDKTITPEDSSLIEVQEDEPILQVREGIDEATYVRIRNANLNDRYTFTNFIVGASNRLAHAAATAVSENPGKSYNPLFIYGPTGLGKTHLLQAIGRFMIDKDPHTKVLYCTTENFLNDMVMAIRTNTTDRFREKYRKLDLLLIDDIQMISNRKETQSEFFNTFNVLFQASKQIVITSDRTPEEIPNVEERLISRFKGGMIADISKPDFEERAAILEQKMKDFSIVLPQKTVRYIADIITDNIRDLEGSLQKINLYSTMKKEELTQAEIARILGKDQNSKRKQVKITTILKKVADEFGVSSKDLKGPRRTKDIAFARQVCMYILREEFGYKLQDVSTLLKRTDHTTALHALDKIQSMVQSNITFKEQIDNLISEIQKPLLD